MSNITDDKVRELLSELTTTYDVANKLCDNHHNIIKVCQSLLASREEVKRYRIFLNEVAITNLPYVSTRAKQLLQEI